jgi:hypothetical protein
MGLPPGSWTLPDTVIGERDPAAGVCAKVAAEKLSSDMAAAQNCNIRAAFLGKWLIAGILLAGGHLAGMGLALRESSGQALQEPGGQAQGAQRLAEVPIPPVFLSKSAQAVENKGCGREKERKERKRVRKSVRAQDLSAKSPTDMLPGKSLAAGWERDGAY